MPFSTLSGEIRNAIYHHIINSNAIAYYPDPKYRTILYSTIWNDGKIASEIASDDTVNKNIRIPRSTAYNVALANHEISTEFLSYAYHHATFTFHLNATCTSSWKFWNVSSHTLSQLRHLRFVRDCRDEGTQWCLMAEREVHFSGLVAKCPLLESVEIEVVLTEEQMESPLVEVSGKWRWWSTVDGVMGERNVWVVPREEWMGLWVV